MTLLIMHTVKQLAKLAGISVRTLHYYDEIGLLKPSSVGVNGYRYYEDKALMRLQQILFYRELDLRLDEIKRIVSSPDFDAINALQAHKRALLKRVERLNCLINTVDNTILNLKGTKVMSKKQLFEAFSEEQQEKFGLEAERKYDPLVVKESNRKWKSYSVAEKQRILDEGNEVYEDLVAAMLKGADSPEVQAIIERWRKHMDYFWTPNLDQLVGLAEGYNKDVRFKANFDKIDPRLAEFILEAVKVYVKSKK
jgi:MerR family transcriptional regulator, thiopeptide resistance regulator